MCDTNAWEAGTNIAGAGTLAIDKRMAFYMDGIVSASINSRALLAHLKNVYRLYVQAMAESVAKMKAQHGLVPDFALIDGPYAPAALKEDPDVEVAPDFEPDLDWTLALTKNHGSDH